MFDSTNFKDFPKKDVGRSSVGVLDLRWHSKRVLV